MNLQILTFDKLGGIQTNKALTDFYEFEALDAKNGFFDITGAFTKRKGGLKDFNTTLAGKVLGLYDFRYNNGLSQSILFAADENIYDRGGGVPSIIQSGQTTTNLYDFETLLDHCFIVNGSDPMLKYDGTTVTSAGISAPLTAPTATPAVGGTLTPSSTYQVAVTFVDSSVPIESNRSPTQTVVLGVGQNQINLTNIPVSTDPQVDSRNIYVTNPGGTALFFYATIPDNTTTVLNITSPPVGGLLEEDHDTPPDGLVGIEEFKDRLFGFKDDTVYFSKDFAPWYWPQGEIDPEKQFFFAVGNSDPITGIKKYFDVLLIFKRFEVFVLSGNNEIDFRVERLKSDEKAGAVSNWVAQVIDNYCYFVGQDSIYRTNGVTVEDIGEDLNDFFNRNALDTTKKVNKSLLNQAVSTYDKENNNYLIFVTTGVDLENKTCLCLDTNSIAQDPKSGKAIGKWSVWDGFTTTYANNVFLNSEERWWRGDDLGYIFQQETLDGDGSNVTSFSTGGNTATTINDTAQAFTVNSLNDLRIEIISGTGEGQERLISSNTATEITVSSAWDDIPDATSEYSIGPINFFYQHSWNSYGNKSLSKRWRYVRPRVATLGSYPVDLMFYYDFSPVQDEIDDLLLEVQGTLWDIALWDVNNWDGTNRPEDLVNVPSNRIHRWSTFSIRNNASGQPVSYEGIDKLFHGKGFR